MATLEERLDEAGVKTLEELEAKIVAEATAAVETEIKEAKDALKKQIEDLEKIKGTQGTEIGDLRKRVEEAEKRAESLKNLEESKQVEDGEGQASSEKSEAELRQENIEREKAFTDEQRALVNKALADAPPEAQELAKTEAGRKAFYDKYIGSTQTPRQVTFDRPQEKTKLTVAEQLDQYLNKNKDNSRPPALQSSGIGTSNSTNEQDNKAGQTVVNASIAERLAARQTA